MGLPGPYGPGPEGPWARGCPEDASLDDLDFFLTHNLQDAYQPVKWYRMGYVHGSYHHSLLYDI